MLVDSGELASALRGQFKYTEAMEIEREVLVARTSLLDTEHERTLISANNLGDSLVQCNWRDTYLEGEQLLRDTLT